MEDKVEKTDKDKIKMGFPTSLKVFILSFKIRRMIWIGYLISLKTQVYKGLFFFKLYQFILAPLTRVNAVPDFGTLLLFTLF